MLCDKCKQKEAVVIIQQTNANGKVLEYNLCASCAAQTAGGMSFHEIMQSFMNSIMNMSPGPMVNISTFGEEEEPFKQSLKCPTCGMTDEGFKNGVKLGCADCYATFRNRLVTIFKNVHGSASHSGKVPNRTGVELLRGREINELKGKLKYLVESEEFEEAAKVRDKIKELTMGS